MRPRILIILIILLSGLVVSFCVMMGLVGLGMGFYDLTTPWGSRSGRPAGPPPTFSQRLPGAICSFVMALIFFALGVATVCGSRWLIKRQREVFYNELPKRVEEEG